MCEDEYCHYKGLFLETRIVHIYLILSELHSF